MFGVPHFGRNMEKQPWHFFFGETWGLKLEQVGFLGVFFQNHAGMVGRWLIDGWLLFG